MEFIIVWLLCGLICTVIAGAKGRSSFGHFFIGVLFGPLGVILSLVMPKNTDRLEKLALNAGDLKKCPQCAEIVKSEAIKCKHCLSELPQPKVGKVVKTQIDASDLDKNIALCECGESFKYNAIKQAGKMATCPGCEARLVLP